MKLKKCSMSEFNIRTIGRKIICYGAGNELRRILRNYHDEDWIRRIEYVADGNSDKNGEMYNEEGFSRIIISKDNLIKLNLKDKLLLITSTAYVEIVEQLNCVKELENIECYVFHYMFGLGDGNKICVRTTEKMLIPAKIHYCWFGKGEMPDLYKKCIESWHKYCPTYEIIEWNEENCDINEIPFTKHAYEHKKYGFVPDYFRLKILYENGGIYLDTDVELIKSLDDLRYNKAFCGMQFPGEIALGLGFGALKGNVALYEMMNWYIISDFEVDGVEKKEVPSPEIQSDYMHSYGMKYGNKMQTVNGFTVYPIEVLSPKNVCTHEINISPNTYAIHHYDGSWTTGVRKTEIQKRIEGSQRISRLFDEGESKL